ncbi:hypothetical protein GCM10023194_81500 [Planotetraspora phitsanulokensis]|uniref:Uncharacterized protein n=1 Tax=Planotetraspora phitsanulokensis TaxID=575192 RepID=A0A8J3UIF8_9ACTN|nr:hypothetical protein [Planotetraspora phitsanulokensis]GII42884.1 hypothetical protein Pph01_78870 [Planotetraspora phitsanulokensis]
MIDELVSTGDGEADAYLRICKTILIAQAVKDRATRVVEDGDPGRAMLYLGEYGDAVDLVEQTEVDMHAAWDVAHRHYRIALDRNPAAAEMADSWVEAAFNHLLTPPSGRHHHDHA